MGGPRLPVAVVDTTLLWRLADLDLADKLPWIFDSLRVPAEVFTEVGRRPGKARRKLKRIIGEMPDFINRCTDVDQMVLDFLKADLDPGESAVIAQAFQLRVRRNMDAVVLIDEHKGRKKARGMEIGVVRTGEVLKDLKGLGVVGLVAPYLDRLNQTGFYLTAVERRKILQDVGE